MRYSLLSSLLFLICFSSYSQTWRFRDKDDTSTNEHYRVDTALRSEIEPEITKWEAKKGPGKGGLMDVEIFVNDNETFSTENKDKIGYFFPYLDVNERDSIIQIVGSSGTEHEGYGFRILIHKNECIVLYLVKKDGDKIFKRSKNEPVYRSYAMVKTQYHLTLTKAPTFKEGDVIEGLVELRGYAYYEKSKDGEDKKSMNIVAAFKTAPIRGK